MKLFFHGGARQVGRSCIELQTQGDRYLLDCGVKFKDDGFEYPEKVFEIKEVDGVFISHSHLDHTGALPFFEHHNLICPIFMTAQTKPITKILLKDSYKIARIKEMHPAFNSVDLKRVKRATRTVDFDKKYHFRKVNFSYFNAGHIPGSASIKFEVEGKKLLYTGDLNTRDTLLMKPANPRDFGEVDILITESTYGARQLPRRDDLYEEFLNNIERIIKQGGRVLIPVFALGRAQEILIMLSKRKWKVPIYFDGMAKQITRKVLTNPSKYIKNKAALNKMYFEVVDYVANEDKRNDIAQKPGIFVTTSGMMQGGPALHYLKHMWHDEKSATFLTGYQVKHTNGWLLNTYKEAYIKGWKTQVKCEVKKFDFSGHLDQDDLHQMILSVNPKILIIQHGNEESVDSLKSWAEKNLKAKIYAPEVGEEIIIE